MLSTRTLRQYVAARQARSRAARARARRRRYARPLHRQAAARHRALVRDRPRARRDAEGQRVVHPARSRAGELTRAPTRRWTSSRPTSTSRAPRTPRRAATPFERRGYVDGLGVVVAPDRRRRAGRRTQPFSKPGRYYLKLALEDSIRQGALQRHRRAAVRRRALDRGARPQGRQAAPKEPEQAEAEPEPAGRPTSRRARRCSTVVGGGLAALGFAGAGAAPCAGGAMKRAPASSPPRSRCPRRRRTAQEGTPIVGGGSFNTAPLLEPGRYADTVAAGETVYWKVELAKGQVSRRARPSTRLADRDGLLGDGYHEGLDHLDYTLDLFTPAARAAQRRERRRSTTRPPTSRATTTRARRPARRRPARARLRADPGRRLQRRQVPGARRVVHLAQRRRLRHLARRVAGRAAGGPRGHGRGHGEPSSADFASKLATPTPEPTEAAARPRSCSRPTPTRATPR